MFPGFIIVLGCLIAPVADSPAASDCHSYLLMRIACDEDEERYVAEAYDAFLTLCTTRELQASQLHFPAHLAGRHGNHVLIERAYYIAPNELRGFELRIPSDLVSEYEGIFGLTADVSIGKASTRQGITVFLLQEKEACGTEP